MTRRGFLLGSGAAFGFAAAAGRLGLLESAAHAALSFTGYRALVCIFLGGGNDSNNMVIPTTGTRWTNYQAVRPVSDTNIGLKLADMQAAGTLLNPVGGAAGSFALHPMMPKLARLFNGVNSLGQALPGGPRLAIVSNVGPLVAPMTKTQYQNGTVPKPDYLMSHDSQVAAWESAIADPLNAASKGTGWGGRLADKLTIENPAVGYPEGTSVSGKRLFLEGQIRKALVNTAGGNPGVSSTGSAAVNAIRNGAAAQLLGVDTGKVLVDGYRDVYERALADVALRASAVAGNPLPADVAALFPNTTLGNQLKQIALEMLAGAATGGSGLRMKRQVFFASLGGFDTHTGQLAGQSALYAQIDNALDAFHQAVALINTKVTGGALPNLSGPIQATCFTMSDFGRTFLPNGNLGTDHGWGSHMLVLGNQVFGGKIYGTFPDLALGGSFDIGDQGRWIPGISVEQYTLPLAKWMGLTDADKAYVFPRAGNFGASPAFIGT